MKAISLIIGSYLLLILASCGSVENENIQPSTGMTSKDRQYQQCFQESDSFKNTNVKPTGQVTLKFTLMPDGKIEDEKIASTDFKDANFHACLLGLTRDLKLDPKKDPINVTKTINFSSKIKINE